MPGNDIKLTYFNLAGRAELSRLILAYAGAKYEDCRITGEQWKELKPKTSCGQLPTLCWNGVEIAQSMTIARFLAKEFHIAGKCTLEQAKADMVVDCVSDLFAAMLKHFFEKDEKLKAEYKKKFDEETLPNGMAVLEKLLCANGGKYFAGDSVSFDCFLTHLKVSIRIIWYTIFNDFQTSIFVHIFVTKSHKCILRS